VVVAAGGGERFERRIGGSGRPQRVNCPRNSIAKRAATPVSFQSFDQFGDVRVAMRDGMEWTPRYFGAYLQPIS
jgi:hypothetical protein